MAEPASAGETIAARVLALCGRSLFIEGLEASLRDRERVEIVLLDTSRPGTVQLLDKLSPDIIIFDLTPSELSSVFPVLRTRTEAVLIGLDIERDLALVLSAEWRQLPTVEDLLHLIDTRIEMKNGRRL